MATKEFCECGASMSATGPFSNQLLREFERLHSGDGHMFRVTREEAARIRNNLPSEGRTRSRLLEKRKRTQEALARLDAKVAALGN